ncbi:MAG: hypothetical protein ACREBR_03465 [bacterium]
MAVSSTKGNPVTDIAEDPEKRKDNIKYFLFDVTVNAETILDSITEPEILIQFALRLPQSRRATSTGTTEPCIRTPSTGINGGAEVHGGSGIRGMLGTVTTDEGERVTGRVLDFTEASPTPKMAAVLRRARREVVGTTFTGSLAFLDDQATFDSVFPHAVPMTLVKDKNRIKEETEDVAKKITAFVSASSTCFAAVFGWIMLARRRIIAQT